MSKLKLPKDELSEDESEFYNQIIKAESLGPIPEGAESRQIPDDPFSTSYEEGDAVKPPFNPVIWSGMLDISTRLRRAVYSFARNTVGLGWKFVPLEDQQNLSDADKKQIKDETERGNQLFMNPNPELPFSELMELIKIDEESTGNGYMEITRNVGGDPSQLWHMPAHTMRVRKGLKRGFVQIRGGRKRYFKCWGDATIIDSRTGRTLEETREAEGEESFEIAPEWMASEVLHFKIYYGKSDYYGAPRWIAASPAIVGNRQAAEWNVSFLRNNAYIPFAILVQNGHLDTESMKTVQEFVQQTKGIANAGRVLILQSQAKNAIPMAKDQQTRIEIEKLSVGVQDDASFLKYREANDEEIREAFGIARIHLGDESSVNKATAQVSRQITNEQVFLPDALTKEYRLRHTILRELGLTKVGLQFIRPKSTDIVADAGVIKEFIKGGALSPNDLRVILGQLLPDFKFEIIEADWAKQPIQILAPEVDVDADSTDSDLAATGTEDG